MLEQLNILMEAYIEEYELPEDCTELEVAEIKGAIQRDWINGAKALATVILEQHREISTYPHVFTEYVRSGCKRVQISQLHE